MAGPRWSREQGNIGAPTGTASSIVWQTARPQRTSFRAFPRRRTPMNPSTILGISLVVWVVWFAWMVRSIDRLNNHAPLQKQVVALKAGETFVGVMERRRGQYVWSGNDWGRYEEHFTPHEISLLRQALSQ